jgi:hypothetical protein
VGQFEEGKRHGQGVLTSLDGRKYKGFFSKRPALWARTMIYPDGRKEIVIEPEGRHTS